MPHAIQTIVDGVELKYPTLSSTMFGQLRSTRPARFIPRRKPLISGFRARLRAWRFVRANEPVAAFMKHQLGMLYEWKPTSEYPPNIIVDIDDDGNIVERPNPLANDTPHTRLFNDRAGVGFDNTGDSLVHVLRAVNRARARTLVREFQNAQEEFLRLNARLLDIVDQEEDGKEAMVRGIGDGSVGIEPTRQVLRFPRYGVLVAIGIVLALLAEAYQFAFCYWSLTGINPRSLGRQFVGNPVGVIGGAGFALATSLVLFIIFFKLVQLIDRTVSDLVAQYAALRSATNDNTPIMATLRVLLRRKGPLIVSRSVAIAALVALVLTLSFSVGALRDQQRSMRLEAGASAQVYQSAAEVYPPAAEGRTDLSFVFTLLTFAVPLAAALLHHYHLEPYFAARRELRHRIEISNRRRMRLAEQLRLIDAERHLLEEKQGVLRVRMSELENEEIEAERMLRQELEYARAEIVDHVHRMIAALHRVRLEYEREARRRKKEALVGIKMLPRRTSG